ncbi:RsbRD N-terminal domain-containing protein [Desulfocurvibacter africanus]|uniref:RsbRD N-terminal domain-containing protein n=1 Tax=Desulfocurvibacter africanus TaxID=873 RepID=UPI002FD9C1ED
MQLSVLIQENKAAVVDKWFDHLLSSFPPETQKIWKKNKDRFTNPVCHIFHASLEGMVDGLVSWQDAEALARPLSDLLKVRAVQDVAPSKSLSFIFGFKKVLREMFGGQADAGELGVFDTRVDNLVLMAFDLYTKNREQVFCMRIDEFKHAHHMAFRKAGIICESPRQALGLEDRNVNAQGK